MRDAKQLWPLFLACGLMAAFLAGALVDQQATVAASGIEGGRVQVQGCAGPGAETGTCSPVQISGRDGTDHIRSIATDLGGNLSPANSSLANADGALNTNLSPTNWQGTAIYARNFPYWFNGTSWDRARGTAANGALVDVSQTRTNTGSFINVMSRPGISAEDFTFAFTAAAVATTQIAPGTAGKQTYVTYWGGAIEAAGTIRWISGTGATCGSGTADISGAIPLIASTPAAFGSGVGAVLRTNALGDNICAVTTGVGAIFQGSITVFRQ